MHMVETPGPINPSMYLRVYQALIGRVCGHIMNDPTVNFIDKNFFHREVFNESPVKWLAPRCRVENSAVKNESAPSTLRHEINDMGAKVSLVGVVIIKKFCHIGD